MSQDDLFVEIDVEETIVVTAEVPDISVVLKSTPDVIVLAAGGIGPPGEDGEDGTDGAQGPPGPTGPQGPTGPHGADSTVPGPQGPQGAKGDKGDTGTTGSTGAPGAPGSTGPQGPQGAKGDKGDTGSQGVPGTTGSTGPAGPGVPAGGAIGQALVKKTATDYDTQWAAVAAPGSRTVVASTIAAGVSALGTPIAGDGIWLTLGTKRTLMVYDGTKWYSDVFASFSGAGTVGGNTFVSFTPSNGAYNVGHCLRFLEAYAAGLKLQMSCRAGGQDTANAQNSVISRFMYSYGPNPWLAAGTEASRSPEQGVNYQGAVGWEVDWSDIPVANNNYLTVDCQFGTRAGGNNARGALSWSLRWANV